MTQWGYEAGDDAQAGNDSELSGPKALRDAYEAMKRQNDELNSKLTSFLEDQTRAKMATVFESLGIPEAAKVYQGPADPSKAKEWAESMKAVFGGNQGGTPPVADSQPAAEPTLSPNMQAQFQRMTEAGQAGVPLGNVDAAFAAVGDASNTNDLIAAFKRATQVG